MLETLGILTEHEITPSAFELVVTRISVTKKVHHQDVLTHVSPDDRVDLEEIGEPAVAEGEQRRTNFGESGGEDDWTPGFPPRTRAGKGSLG
jgi:hypothetical protein